MRGKNVQMDVTFIKLDLEYLRYQMKDSISDEWADAETEEARYDVFVGWRLPPSDDDDRERGEDADDQDWQRAVPVDWNTTRIR